MVLAPGNNGCPPCFCISGWKQQFSDSAHPNLQSVRDKHFHIYNIETLYYIVFMIQNITISQSGRKLQIAQRIVRHHSWVSQTCCPTLANTFCYLVLWIIMYTFFMEQSKQSQIGFRTGDLAEDSAKPLLGDTNLRSDLGKHLSFYIIMNIYKIITLYHISISETLENSRFGRWQCDATPVPLTCVGITSSVLLKLNWLHWQAAKKVPVLPVSFLTTTH